MEHGEGRRNALRDGRRAARMHMGHFRQGTGGTGFEGFMGFFFCPLELKNKLAIRKARTRRARSSEYRATQLLLHAVL